MRASRRPFFKRVLTTVLAVVLVLGLMPTGAWAAVADFDGSGDQQAVVFPLSASPLEASDYQMTATVTVSISRYGKFMTSKDGVPMAQMPVKLTGKSSYTIDDALYAAHEQYYEGGAAAGYLSTATNWGTRLDGENIDYFLVSKTGFTVERYKVMRNTYNGVYPSDHFPIVTKLKVE